MKVEVVSIGTELLASDILDTNAAFISRSLQDVNVTLTCKVTVGDDPEMIADTLRVAMRRADIVITTGGLGLGTDDFTREGIARATQCELDSEDKRLIGAKVIGGKDARVQGIFIEGQSALLFSLPGNRREMSYLLEIDVLPYIRRRTTERQQTGWLLLRTVGVMESSLKQQLADLVLSPSQQITFDSFAGQTNVKLSVAGDSQKRIEEELKLLQAQVMERLGDHIFGVGEDRLEDVIWTDIVKGEIKLAIAECYTGRILAKTIESIPDSQHRFTAVPTTTWSDLADYLHLSKHPAPELDLTRWCRTIAEKLLEETDSNLGLVVYNNITRGGVQVLVTLASPHGVSVTQRSFGGHPDNINHWACTLGLTHLRRWLMAHN